jgi:hypothetical protein
MFSYLWYGAYEKLVVSSVGLKRFNLLGSSSSRAGIGSLGCVISFSRYLVLKLVIFAWTAGICRSVCIIVLGTYRGALMIDLRTLFWNRCSTRVIQKVSTVCAYLSRILETVTLRMCSDFLHQLRSHRRHFVKIVLCICLFLCVNHV